MSFWAHTHSPHLRCSRVYFGIGPSATPAHAQVLKMQQPSRGFANFIFCIFLIASEWVPLTQQEVLVVHAKAVSAPHECLLTLPFCSATLHGTLQLSHTCQLCPSCCRLVGAPQGWSWQRRCTTTSRRIWCTSSLPSRYLTLLLALLLLLLTLLLVLWLLLLSLLLLAAAAGLELLGEHTVNAAALQCGCRASCSLFVQPVPHAPFC